MTSQYTTDPTILPENLPQPIDDGAADHLTGMRMPNVALQATSGGSVNLSTRAGRTVVYAYPMTGVPGVELPPGWNDIPGARGCTPQALSFQDQKGTIAALGSGVYGLSTQTPEYQKELSDRLGLSFEILSDVEFALVDALNLPTMTVEDLRLIKRLTLVLNDGIIERVFYPVFPSDKATAEVVAWLRKNPVAGSVPQGMLIYSTADCPHCRAAKALLGERGIAFTEVDIEREPDAATIMAARSGRNTVPQIFIGNMHIGDGSDLQALDRSNELVGLL